MQPVSTDPYLKNSTHTVPQYTNALGSSISACTTRKTTLLLAHNYTTPQRTLKTELLCSHSLKVR